MEPAKSSLIKSLSGNWQTPHWGWGVLATVVLVVVGTGVPFGIPAYRQRQAILAFKAIGGKVTTHKSGPEWLRNRVGDKWMEVFDDAESLELNNLQVADTDFEELRWLTNLEHLNLVNTHVVDGGLRHLKWLKKLKKLRLGDSLATEANMVSVGELTNLEDLSIFDRQFNDAGLAHLKGMTSLRALHFDGQQITDTGLEHLRGLTNLHVIDLAMQPPTITDTGIGNLTRSIPRLVIYSGFIQYSADRDGKLRKH